MTTEATRSTNSLEYLLEQLPSDSDERGKLFEKVTKWFLKKDPTFASELREVWLWDEWPEADGPDVGIDIVAETYDGNLWAIQAKCYDIDNYVPTSDIDRFLAASADPKFAHRLLISTGPISKLGERTINKQNEYKSTAFFLRHNLTESPVDWLAFLDESRPALPDKKTPRDHQQHAIDDVIASFASNDKGRLVMACGTGKTLVSLWISERLESSRTLVLVPSLTLLDQVSKEWQANSSESLRPLFVCSDQTVGDDIFVSNTAELGHPPTTDSKKIRDFLSGPGKRIVFSTYQSSPKISEAQSLGAPEFDFVIADEAHHCAGKVDSAFATVLDPITLKARKRLFMTATPKYATRRLKDAAAQADIQVASMDDIDVFGPEMHVLTFGKAIEQNLLSDYQVLILGITNAEIEELTHHRRFVDLFGSDWINNAEYLAHLVGTMKAIREYDLQFLLSFHNRVVRAQRFVSRLKDLNDILPAEEGLTDLWLSHISGGMTARQRNQLLEQFKNGRGRVNLLSNAKCLGEGIDIPGIDGVAFIDPRRSVIEIAQAVGRAIRKSEPEKKGTIVLPVFIDEHSELLPEKQLENSRFEAIWGVLNALRAHDEVLAEELDSLRYQLGRHGGGLGPIPGKIITNFSTTVGMEFVNAIETKLVETTTESWEFWYGLLERFTEREGHSRPVHDAVEAGAKLGYWVNNQRHRKDILRPDQIDRLESLPGWAWDATEHFWERSFSALEKYVELEGNARPPSNYITDDGLQLGKWVGAQRVRTDERFTPERVSRLESLHGWAWNTIEFRWEQNFSALERFVELEGHARPNGQYVTEDGLKLGNWVVAQRVRPEERLTPSRISRLSSLPGWAWNTFDFNWEENFSALKTFIDRGGHARPAASYVTESGLTLGSWVSVLRSAKNKLSQEKLSLLESLSGWAWNAREFLWEQNFSALERFVELEGHARPVATYVTEDGLKLGSWVVLQRIRPEERLTPSQISRLSSLPGWTWNPADFNWEENFTALKTFTAREGHSRPTDKYTENGFNLGSWVSTQRMKSSQLTGEQRSCLESLPGWTWDALEFLWEQNFSALERFVELEGHARPVAKYMTEDGLKLGSWVTKQRSNRASLAPDRIAQLEPLPGWTWNAVEFLWEQGFMALQKYINLEGHARPPAAYRTEAGFTLGSWVSVKRSTRNKLTPEKIAQLEALPGWVWSAR